MNSNGVNVEHPVGFIRDRNLLEYVWSFPKEVSERISNMGSTGQILDLGSGESIAAEQLFHKDLAQLYHTTHDQMVNQGVSMVHPFDPAPVLNKISDKSLNGRPQVIAVTKEIERKVNTAVYQEKLKIISGDFFEDIPDAKLGHPDVILDKYGVFSYTAKPKQDLDKCLRVLKVGGEINMNLDRMVKDLKVTTEIDPANLMDKKVVQVLPRNWEAKEIARATVELPDGRVIDFMDWLKGLKQPGLEVETYAQKFSYTHLETPPYTASEEKIIGVRIRKTADVHFEIPELELIGPPDTRFNPPRRHFRQVIRKP